MKTWRPVSSPGRPRTQWRDYNIIMWQQHTKNLIPHLERLGINAGQYSAATDSLPGVFHR